MALAVAVPVQGATPTTVNVEFCDRYFGSEVRVGRRSETTLFYGWVTSARRQAVKFLDRSYVELTVDGSPVANADLLWSRPFQLEGSNLWGVIWEYDLGRLGPGNSIETNFKLTFTQSHWDGFERFEPGTFADHDCRVFTRA